VRPAKNDRGCGPALQISIRGKRKNHREGEVCPQSKKRDRFLRETAEQWKKGGRGVNRT